MIEPTDVLECGVGALVPVEIERLQAIIADLEAKNHVLIEESKRLGRVLQTQQTRADNLSKDLDRRVKDVAELRRVVARVQTERDALAARLIEIQKPSA